MTARRGISRGAPLHRVIGLGVKARRLNAGLSLAEAAQRTGMKRDTLQRIEGGSKGLEGAVALDALTVTYNATPLLVDSTASTLGELVRLEPMVLYRPQQDGMSSADLETIQWLLAEHLPLDDEERANAKGLAALLTEAGITDPAIGLRWAVALALLNYGHSRGQLAAERAESIVADLIASGELPALSTDQTSDVPKSTLTREVEDTRDVEANRKSTRRRTGTR